MFPAFGICILIKVPGQHAEYMCENSWQSLNTCPHFLALHLGSCWRCGHEKWTVSGNHNSKAASKCGKSNLQGKMGNRNCRPLKLLERTKTKQYWNIVATVCGACLTSCQGVKHRKKRVPTVSWCPDALILPHIWRIQHFRLSEPKNKYNHPS